MSNDKLSKQFDPETNEHTDAHMQSVDMLLTAAEAQQDPESKKAAFRAAMRAGKAASAEAHKSSKLKRAAAHDVLTGALNRAGFDEALHHEVAETQSHRFENKAIALAFIDLDNFKEINDNCGHSEGDRLLKEVVERLKKVFRDTDMIARVGGDELVIIMPFEKNGRKPTKSLIRHHVNEAIKGLGAYDKEGEGIYYPLGASIGLASTFDKKDIERIQNDQETEEYKNINSYEDAFYMLSDERMYHDKWYGGKPENLPGAKKDPEHPKNMRLAAKAKTDLCISDDQKVVRFSLTEDVLGFAGMQ